ncbi:MAG: hypothetical protein ABL930_00860 [Pseudobdellovibrio sp.]
MKKSILICLLFSSQLVSAKVADFNSMIQTQVNTQKEIHSSLNEEIEAVEVSTTNQTEVQPEIIVLGVGVLPVNSFDKSTVSITNTSTQQVLKPIVIEEKQFVRLGEELSEAQK